MRTVLMVELLGRRVRLETNEPAAAQHLAHVFPTVLTVEEDQVAEFSLALLMRQDRVEVYWQDILLGQYESLQQAVLWADFWLLERLARESGLLVLHGACLIAPEMGIILLGNGSTGKSGMSRLLMSLGFHYGSDEAVGIDDEGWAFPFPRALLLKGEHPDVQSGAAVAATENLLHALDGRVYEAPSVPIVQALSKWQVVELERVRDTRSARLEKLPLVEGLAVTVRHVLDRSGWRRPIFQQLVNRLAERPALRLSFSDFGQGAAQLAALFDRSEEDVENG